MSWVSSLNELYDTNAWRAGELERWKRGNRDNNIMLLPVSHTTVRAQIEITVDLDGNLIDVRALGKDESSETLAPATEDAMSRTSTTVAPYPLFDGLKYLAGDFLEHIKIEMESPQKTEKTKNNIAECYPKYIKFLGAWCSSKYNHPKVNAVYKYVSKKSIIRDLIEREVLIPDNEGMVLGSEKINGNEIPKVTVRFRVQSKEKLDPHRVLADSEKTHETAIWLDKTVQKSFVDYYASLPAVQDLCYMNGEITRTSSLHPKKIRYDGDGTKLFSANDDSNFSYRGRFKTKDPNTGYNEALSIGYETSQKAHNALKWIIRRQGHMRDGVCVAAWESQLNEFPSFYESAANIVSDISFDEGGQEEVETLFLEDEEQNYSDTNYVTAKELSLALDGYTTKLSDTSRIVVLALDSATPGRLAITYYKELESSVYLKNIRLWHESCCWRHEYFRNGKFSTYEGMVSIRDLAQAVYGTEQNKRLALRSNSDGKSPMLMSVYDRLRPCIIDGKSIPRDIVRMATIKASNPLAYESKFNYNKVLHIACSLVKRLYWEKKQRNEEEGVVFTMELDKSNNDRSYLFGRLLSIAEVIERQTYERDERRVTNAERYMQAFAQNPFRTWTMIQRSIKPYLNSLSPGSREYYKNLFGEITELFKDGDFESRTALNGKYLIGYDCQRSALRNKTPKAGIVGLEEDIDVDNNGSEE
ncbi:MAG: type I-C CRISPR-associated protein Cas8c/Csd1 [Anaerovoracaceae bacterium]|jgi:CRISPR-associated protein Csd1|nr:type I-C CRISPR-associated protein Cas8c/Csd1 [Anaerovoracaceae bacterium]